jgi:cell division protein ZapD
MNCDTITFQLGAHYLSRVALRIERLLTTIEQASQEQHPVIHHAALNEIFELIKLTEKPELKSRFLQEFIRIEHAINKSMDAFENTSTETSFSNIFVQIQTLSQLAGTFGGSIHDDAFLHSIGLALIGHGSDGEYYAPQLCFWLEGTATKRQHDLTLWLKQLKPLHDTITLYLSLLRNSATFETITPENGFYQCPIPHNNKTACHLVLVRMSKTNHLIPKIQLGQHGLSLRLCEATSMRETHNKNTTIELSLCTL